MNFLFLVVGIAIGLVVGLMLSKNKASAPSVDQSEELAILKGRFDTIKEENTKITNERSEQNNLILKLAQEKSTLEERQKATEEKIKDLNDVKEKLTIEFENLANKIFVEKMSSFQKESATNMDLVLRPFKEKLGEFQATVSKYREDEIKENSSLKTEIKNIFDLNQKLSQEANNLTKALKGDKKLQGNWGELIVERVFEASGLRKGEEYIVQGKELGLSDSEGKNLKPDFIVNLPEGKHVIVDSKVTLVGYDRFISAADENDRNLAMKDFLTSIKNHINGLSEKKYQNLDKLVTPEFVLMFIPLEGAFATALQLDDQLFSYGWERKIILVSPTNLMVTLRTIDSIWKQEKQNKYAMEIARQAGDLYDKFVGFVDDLQDLKKSLDKSHDHFNSMMNKLTTGKGNIVGRFVKLKELGAKASKTLEIEFESES
jgi:DNA recombination protein RmuC